MQATYTKDQQQLRNCLNKVASVAACILLASGCSLFEGEDEEEKKGKPKIASQVAAGSSEEAPAPSSEPPSELLQLTNLPEPQKLATFDSFLRRLTTVSGVSIKDATLTTVYNQVTFNLPTTTELNLSGSNAVAIFKLCATVAELMHNSVAIRAAFYGPNYNFTATTVDDAFVRSTIDILTQKFWSLGLLDQSLDAGDLQDLTTLATDIRKDLPVNGNARPRLAMGLATAVCASARSVIY